MHRPLIEKSDQKIEDASAQLNIDIIDLHQAPDTFYNPYGDEINNMPMENSF